MSAALIIALWGAIAGYLNEKHAAEIDAMRRDTRNLSHAFEENIRRTIDAIDATIRAVRVAKAADAQNFDIVAWDRDSGLARELTLQLAFADRNGILTDSNLGKPKATVDLADRPHFKAARAMKEDRLFVSQPVLGRVSNRWSIQFVRRLYDSAGGFDGMVVASLDPAFLSRFSKSLDIGNGTLLLLGTDGIVRAAAPETFVPLREDLSSTELMQAVSRTAQGTLETAEIGDHVRRIYSWRHVDPFDLTVVVGLSTADALEEFRRDLTLFCALGVVLTIGVIGAGAMLARRQRQLVGSWRILHAAVENISQGLMVIDPQRRVPVLNRRAVELLSLPPHLAQPGVRFDDILAWQLAAGEFDGPAHAHVRDLVRSGGIAQGNTAYQRRCVSGATLDVRTQVLSNGLAVRTLTDITESQRTADVLAEARDRAEAAVRAKSEFLAIMSHEIRTPLNGVIGVTELLQGMELGPTQRDYVQTIRESGDHLLQLINDILDFSRLEASRVELEEVAFDPSATVRSMADLFRTQASQKGLELTATFTRVPAAVIGDPGRLRQVLFNLVGNAIKFTERGWVDITLAAEELSDDRVRMLIRVTDTGIGIEPESIQFMFEKFTQADGSISRRFGGSGLGLAICQRLVTLMGGTIRVESQLGKGSAFHFELTLRTAPVPSEESPMETGEHIAVPAHPMNVLVAEDNRTNQMVALRLLNRLGHTGVAVENGVQAVAAAADNHFDLILMDVMMPQMDGLSATRLIRASEPPGIHVPIIGLTADSQTEHLDRCLASGMDNVTTKPITLARLKEVIASALDRSQPLREAIPSSRMQELRDELGDDVVAEILATFVEETAANLLSLWEAGSSGDAQSVQRVAHSITGAARNVGLTALANHSRSLEEGAGRLSVAQIMAVVAAMQQDFDDAVPRLADAVPAVA
ncbi:MAG: PAS-domain containing protein [Proteobacteria bacterium]|nr:PAS-domain containing protein [Pseudomonadota bacterium]